MPSFGRIRLVALPWVLTGVLAAPGGGLASELRAETDAQPPAREPGGVEPTGERPWADWLVLPVVSYDRDVGLCLGAAGQVQILGDRKPYSHQLTAQLLFTTGRTQSHWARYDAPRFLGTGVRLWARIEYRHELHQPWYGAGNDSSTDLTSRPELTASQPFAFERTMPMARVGAAQRFGPEGLNAFAFLGYAHVGVGAPEGSLLAVERPIGAQGGGSFGATAGLFYDGRDDEAVSGRGTYVEASVRGAVVVVAAGPAYGFSAFNGRWLQFVPLGGRLVVANRLELDALGPNAPFWELASFGGIDLKEGIGGQSSVRGIPQNRFAGRVKLLENLELRGRIASARVLGEPLHFGAVLFLDLGRVWQLEGRDGSPWDFHAGYGGGLRLWRRSFVLRLDVGSSAERPVGVYALFGHFF